MATSGGRKSRKTRKTKITVLLQKEVFDIFCASVKELGLRRDLYLNRVLGDGIRCLTETTAGSLEGAFFRRTLRSHAKDLIRVGITLDTDVAKAMNDACSERHVLRDEFLEAFLADLDGVLGQAATMILNPGALLDQNAYDNLPMSEEAVASLVAKLSDTSNSGPTEKPATGTAHSQVMTR